MLWDSGTAERVIEPGSDEDSRLRWPELVRNDSKGADSARDLVCGPIDATTRHTSTLHRRQELPDEMT